MDGNYIKICRSLLDWEWFGNPNTLAVFMYCLLKANWKDGRFEGIEVPRGSFVTSVARLAKDVGISTQSARTALNRLKSTNELTIKTTTKYSVITVNNYGRYQDTNKPPNKRLTNEQQTTNNNRRSKEDNKSISKDILSVMNAWNELGLSQVRQIAPGTKRYKDLQARIKTHGVDGVLEAIAKIPLSDFLQGGGERGWVITLDWLVKSPDNFQKVLEGIYTEKKQTKKKGGTSGFKLYD